MPVIEVHLERYVGPEPTAWLYGTKNGEPMLPALLPGLADRTQGGGTSRPHAP